MYYKEKFENGKWWVQSIPNGKWYEMSLEGYKVKAIDLSTKAVKENDFIDDVVETLEEAFDRGYTVGMNTGVKLMGKGSL